MNQPRPLSAAIAPAALLLRDGETQRADVGLRLRLFLSGAPNPAECGQLRRVLPSFSTAGTQWTQAHHYPVWLQTADSADESR